MPTDLAARTPQATSTVRRVVSWLWPCVALAGIGWFDSVTRLSFFPFYVVVLIVVSLRRWWPVAMGFGVLAAAIVLTADLISMPALRWSLDPYWRAGSNLVGFGLITFTIPRLIEERRRLSESEAQLMRQRREIHELNTALVQALEDRAAERERAIKELVGEHASEIRNLREVVQQVRAAARRAE